MPESPKDAKETFTLEKVADAKTEFLILVSLLAYGLDSNQTSELIRVSRKPDVVVTTPEGFGFRVSRPDGDPIQASLMQRGLSSDDRVKEVNKVWYDNNHPLVVHRIEAIFLQNTNSFTINFSSREEDGLFTGFSIEGLPGDYDINPVPVTES